jgi:hypothetical protein
MFVIDYLRYLLGFRHKVYALRKKYDHMREHADRQRNSQKRLAALRILDQVEPSLVMLEEQNISGFERGRLARYVVQGVENARRVLNEKFSSENSMKRR